MAGRSSREPLYEKMRRAAAKQSAASGGNVQPGNVQPGNVQPPRPAKPVPAPVSTADAGTVGGGGGSRMLRVPMGYLLLGSAAVVLLLVGAYIVGHQTGETTAHQEYSGRLDLPEGLLADQPIDPLQGYEAQWGRMGEGEFGVSGPKIGGDVLTRVDEMGVDGGSVGPQGGDDAYGGGSPTESAGGAATWGPIEPASDPRTPGYNYFILMETFPDGAKQLAEFLRAEGLEAYLVAGGKSTRRRVIVMPGFDRSARNSEPIQAVEQEIRRAGRKWQATKGGRDDLGGYYPSLYRD